MLIIRIIKVFITLVVIVALAVVYATVLDGVFALIASFCTGSYLGFQLEEGLFEKDDDIYV